MRALVDKVEFTSRPQTGTVVHLEKAIVWDAAAPGRLLSDGQPKTIGGPWSERRDDGRRPGGGRPRPGSLGPVKIGVITFPGSLDDRDAQRAVRLAGGEPVALWHGDADLRGVDAVVLPGGFSYGDHLRAGAIARFAPAMGTVADAAKGGMPVLGICNGFQVLCE